MNNAAITEALAARAAAVRNGGSAAAKGKGSFLDAVAQLGGEAAAEQLAGGGLFLDPLARCGAMLRTETAPAQAVTLEEMLNAKYGNVAYHVFDAGSRYWRTRNDYPHYLLYQDGDAAKDAMENWMPSGENPFYGSIDGRFIAPKEIRALGSVPPGSKAVVIHPAVQERMGQDPEYAQEIMNRIEGWFALDVARNEAIMPGSTWDMSQAVAIGEDGNICNACASSANGEITQSSGGADNSAESWWEMRLARHTEYMKRIVEERAEHRQQEMEQIADASLLAAAKARLAAMLADRQMEARLGEMIAGIPTAQIIELTRQQVWG